jgi:uncharacterized protein involved in exopolysaccharide biosynthesis
VANDHGDRLGYARCGGCGHALVDSAVHIFHEDILRRPGGESVTDLAQGSTFTEKQMASYAQVAQSPIVLEPVAESLNLDVRQGELSDALSITVAADTTILVVAATDEDPVLARDIANAVADQLATTVGSLSLNAPMALRLCAPRCSVRRR